jgi:hypothetical protein
MARRGRIGNEQSEGSLPGAGHLHRVRSWSGRGGWRRRRSGARRDRNRSCRGRCARRLSRCRCLGRSARCGRHQAERPDAHNPKNPADHLDLAFVKCVAIVLSLTSMKRTQTLCGYGHSSGRCSAQRVIAACGVTSLSDLTHRKRRRASPPHCAWAPAACPGSAVPRSLVEPGARRTRA